MVYGEKDRIYHREYNREWRKRNPQKQKDIDFRARQNLRMKVFNYLGGAKCVRCGCMDTRILEINHKNLGGHKEQEVMGHANFLRSILRDKRKDEFEVVCQVCNSAHYCEQKFGAKYKIEYIA
jgi:hypothetical protein